jgi:HSP20 family protein
MFGLLSGFDSDLFGQLERMRREMDALFGTRPGTTGIRSLASGTFPPINVGASPERVDVYVFAPGIDPKALSVSLQQSLLTIAGERTLQYPEDVEFYRQERFDGAFRRVLTLPDDVDPDRVEASYREGVLHIKIQRREEVRPRQIEIK